MNLKQARAVVTGAGGGIGRHLVHELARQGGRVALVGRRLEALEKVRHELPEAAREEALSIAADITTAEGRQRIVEQTGREWGGVDLLVNNAGVVDFHHFASQDPATIERIHLTNTLAPQLLTRALVPGMVERGFGRIVNIGSAFGSIGFPFFASYASSKFALRGFSEALRRELEGSGVGVSYFAPRAVRTKANSEALYRMAEETGMNMDEPERIAALIVRAIARDRTVAHFGWPEKFFARVNALLPRLVDGALRRQRPVIARFAPGAVSSSSKEE